MEQILAFIAGTNRSQPATDPPLKPHSPPPAPSRPLPSLPTRRLSSSRTLPRPSMSRGELPVIGEDAPVAPRAPHHLAASSSPRRQLGKRHQRRMSTRSITSLGSSWSSSSSSSSTTLSTSSSTSGDLFKSATSIEFSIWHLPDAFRRLAKLSSAHGNQFPMAFPRRVERDGITRMITTIYLDVFPGEAQGAHPRNPILLHTITGVGAAQTTDDSKHEAARVTLRDLCDYVGDLCADLGDTDVPEAMPYIRRLFRSIARYVFDQHSSLEIHREAQFGLYKAELRLWKRKSRRQRVPMELSGTEFTGIASDKGDAVRLALHDAFSGMAEMLRDAELVFDD